MGCFPKGTKIRVPKGTVDLDTIQSGDQVVTINSYGEVTLLKVIRAYKDAGSLILINTDHGSVVATPEQPFALSFGQFKKAKELVVGDVLKKTYWSSASLNYIVGAVVTSVNLLEEKQVVFNIEVEEPHTYIAGGFLVHNKGGGGGGQTSTTTQEASIAPELRPLFSQTAQRLMGFQGLGGADLGSFFGPNPQRVPTGMTPQEALGFGQLQQLVNAPVGSSPMTIAAMQAATAPVQNQLALAGLGRSGALGTELAGAFAPILAQEMGMRERAVPMLFGLGAELQGREAQVGEAAQRDFLRRQALAESLTTGILSGFPTVTGGTSVTQTRGRSGGGGGGMLGK